MTDFSTLGSLFLSLSLSPPRSSCSYPSISIGRNFLDDIHPPILGRLDGIHPRRLDFRVSRADSGGRSQLISQLGLAARGRESDSDPRATLAHLSTSSPRIHPTTTPPGPFEKHLVQRAIPSRPRESSVAQPPSQSTPPPPSPRIYRGSHFSCLVKLRVDRT